MKRSKLKLNRETLAHLGGTLRQVRGGEDTCTCCTCCSCVPSCDATCGCPTYATCDSCNCASGRETDCNCI